VKVGIITLGCDKNTVDSERYLAQLSDYSAVYTPNLGEAEVIIVNTCGFIGEAKKESIDTIFELAALKEHGACKSLVVTGCLSQRYPTELAVQMPEVDHFLGRLVFTSDASDDLLRVALGGRRSLQHKNVITRSITAS